MPNRAVVETSIETVRSLDAIGLTKRRYLLIAVA